MGLSHTFTRFIGGDLDDFAVPGVVLADRFRLIREIGRGATSVVWLAHDTRLEDEPVACKILCRDLVGEAWCTARLKQEVLLSRRLRHPSIVGVHTFWDSGADRFITMEHIEGETLAEALRRRAAAFSLDDALPWLGALCDALDYAHGRHVLHCDVKPANILIGTDGGARLADFGIARTLHDARQRLTGPTTSGTVLYMSPEQLTGEPLSPRSDQYSLAATIYELLCGAPPFHKGSVIAHLQLTPPRRIGDLPDPVNDALLRALSKDPERRFASCGAFFVAMSGGTTGMAPGATARGDASCGPLRSDPDADTVRMEPLTRRGMENRLGAILVSAGAITRSQLDQALAEARVTGERLGESLVRLGFADEAGVARALALQLRAPFIDFAHEGVEPEVAGMLPVEIARRRGCVPVRRIGDRVLVAMTDPLDFHALNEVEAMCGRQVEIGVATASGIAQVLDQVPRHQSPSAGGHGLSRT